MARPHGECVYCGKSGPLTRDHIPPRNLFRRAQPVDLITVPACGRCNAAGRKDDEYFRLAITLNEQVAEEPDVQVAIPEVLRSLQRVEAAGFRNVFLRGIHEVERITPAGLYLGRTLAYDVDLNRLGAVCSRMIRGLWYRHHGTRLPDGFTAQALAAAGLRDVDAETFLAASRFFGPMIQAGTIHSVGRVFSYVFSADDHDHRVSAWILLFYRRVVFIGFTSPADAVPPEQPHAAQR